MTARWQELVDQHRCIYCTEFNIDYHVWNYCPACARKRQNRVSIYLMTSVILIATAIVLAFLWLVLR